jgi:endoribonuclease Dicer
MWLFFYFNFQMMLAHNFQEMFLKVLLDRSEFTSSYVMLEIDAALQIRSTFYLLLPIKQKFYGDKFMIDWPTIKRCLASPVFQRSMGLSPHDTYLPNESLKLLDGTYHKADVTGSLVFTPHNNLFFFVDVILDEINGKSEFNGATYEEYFKER